MSTSFYMSNLYQFVASWWLTDGTLHIFRIFHVKFWNLRIPHLWKPPNLLVCLHYPSAPVRGGLSLHFRMAGQVTWFRLPQKSEDPYYMQWSSEIGINATSETASCTWHTYHKSVSAYQLQVPTNIDHISWYEQPFVSFSCWLNPIKSHQPH